MTPTWETDDGRVQLYNADCLAVLSGLEADCVVTDPPYGISLANHARGKERRDVDWTIAGDDSQEIGQAACDWAADAGVPCVVFASPMKPWGGKWRQHLVWEKGEHVSGGGDPWKCWKPSWELLQIARTPDLNGSRDGAVLRFQACKDDYALHPSPKPVALLVYLVEKVSQPWETILDPFMGSGTTGVACIRTGRRFIGVEISEEYFAIAKKRIQDELARHPLFAAEEAAERQMELVQA